MRKLIKIFLIIIVTLAVGLGGYFSYKAFIESRERKDLSQKAGSANYVIEDFSSKFEVGEFTQKKNPKLGLDFWNSVYKAIVKYDPTLEGKYITFVGLRRHSFNEMCEIIGSGEGEDAIKEIKKLMKKGYPNFETFLKIAIMLENRNLRKFYFFKEKGKAVSMHRETAR